MKLSFYLRYAFRSLRRNGQRTVLAAVCVAFGVMSLTALWLLSSIVRDAIIVEPRVGLGGDALLQNNGTNSAAITNTLNLLRGDGVIDRAMLLNEQRGLLLKPFGAPVYILDRALGVDPHTYPLLGTLQLRDGRSLADTLQHSGDVVVSRDVAAKAGLKIGDTVTVAMQGGGVPVRVRVAGIADHMPDRTGATMIYDVATAQQIAGQPDVLRSALVTWGPRGAALETAQCTDAGALPGFAQTATERVLCADGWHLQTATAVSADNQRIVQLFDTMLKGAGLLGLLVGGIGVANTLQVLLARRTGEIATLKTLGYRRRDIVLLISGETALLGVVGSAVGVVAAIGLLYPFMVLLSNTGGSLMADWHVDGGALVGGALAGIATAIIFGVTASVRASAVRPASLLRNQVTTPTGTRVATLGLWIVLGLVFGALSSVIMGSPWLGAGVLVLAVAGLIGLGTVLSGALALLVRVPVRARSILALAQHNLRRQGWRSVFALIALWAGVFAIGFAAASMVSARDRIAGRGADLGGDNIVVQARPTDVAVVEQQMQQQNVQQVRSLVLASISAARADGTPLPVGQIGGRATLGSDVRIVDGAAWNTRGGVYVDAALTKRMANDEQPPLAIGDEIVISAAGGTRTLPVIGVFAPTSTPNYQLGVPQPALLATDATVREMGGVQVAALVIGQAAPDRLAQTGSALSASLPNALVLTTVDFNEGIARALRSFFLFVIAIAGLALVAGAVLIANAVGLALVERRRELGILKAVGYSSGHVLRTLVIEHALLGLLGGVAGIVSVWLVIALINLRESSARLALAPVPALVVVGGVVLLALGSAVLVAWRPTHVRPLAVLREE